MHLVKLLREIRAPAAPSAGWGAGPFLLLSLQEESCHVFVGFEKQPQKDFWVVWWWKSELSRSIVAQRRLQHNLMLLLYKTDDDHVVEQFSHICFFTLQFQESHLIQDLFHKELWNKLLICSKSKAALQGLRCDLFGSVILKIFAAFMLRFLSSHFKPPSIRTKHVHLFCYKLCLHANSFEE